MRLRLWWVVLAIVVAAGVDEASNLAPVPGSWKPYLWVAWPTMAVLLVAAVVLDYVAGHRDRRPDPVADAAPATLAGVTEGDRSGRLVVGTGTVHHPGPSGTSGGDRISEPATETAATSVTITGHASGNARVYQAGHDMYVTDADDLS